MTRETSRAFRECVRWSDAMKRSEWHVVEQRANVVLSSRRFRVRRWRLVLAGNLTAAARFVRWMSLADRLSVHGLRLAFRIVTCGECSLEFVLDRWNLPGGNWRSDGNPTGWTPVCPACRPQWLRDADTKRTRESIQFRDDVRDEDALEQDPRKRKE